MINEYVKDILEKSGFRFFECTGCFDIIAKRKEMILIKILSNVDSLQSYQANNLKIFAKSVGASACLIGLRTRRETLKSGIIYERFGISTFTPDTLESIVFNDLPFIYRNRGGLFAEIDPEKLRKRRTDAGLTQSKLADIIGVTKKNIYEHERQPKGASYEVVKKLESILGDVTQNKELELNFEDLKNEPKTNFERTASKDLKKIGFKTSFVYQSPFNIIAEQPSSEFVLFSDAEKSGNRIEKNLPYIKNFSKLSRKSVLIITKEDMEFDVPTIKESELKVMDSNELKKFIKKW